MQDETAAASGVSESFESVYRGLEEAVGRLEAGGLSLEESIQLYESGMRLALRCKQMLDSAELRVSELEEELTGRDARRIDDDSPDWANGSLR